uniref:Lipoprotein n=1 Tax=Coralloluteibacterium stylophorae TaxID=1776034 RepID=A0A8J7VS63_9GAMM
MLPIPRSLRLASALACLLTVACGPTPRAVDSATAAEEPPAPARHAVADIASGLRKGMAYGDFRQQVLADGWTPMASAECRTNLVGDDADALCAANPQLAGCTICDELPELQACSADARCMLRFRSADGQRVLEARAYGEFQHWDERGADAGLQVSDWTFSTSER